MSGSNFKGECSYQGVSYTIEMDVDTQDKVYLAKIKTSSNNSQDLARCHTFAKYSENKNIFELKEFFLQSSNQDNFDSLFYAYQRGLLNYTGDDVVFKSKCKEQPLVCTCSGLTQKELKQEIQKSMFTMENLVKETKAGTGCGSCRADLKKIMSLYQSFPLLTASSYLRLWEAEGIKGELLCRCKKVPPLEVAELLEKTGLQKGLNLYKNLQTKYGIGLSCTDCEEYIKHEIGQKG